jgi:hemin uptake protein HemP
MNSPVKFVLEFCSKSRLATIFAVVCLALSSHAADSAVQVQLSTKDAGPRAIESLTERGILRDYRFAWTGMAQALELNTLDPLEGPFAGEAKQQLMEAVASQQHTNLSQQYVNQNHRLEAVFYAPEGDVMELHDTAEYQLRVSDAGKVIHDEHVVMHFIVLMTPAADRWVIRQLQAVPQF